MCTGLGQIPAGMFSSTCQRLEVKVKIHSNDHEMSGWPVGSDVCVCVCVCAHACMCACLSISVFIFHYLFHLLMLPAYFNLSVIVCCVVCLGNLSSVICAYFTHTIT